MGQTKGKVWIGSRGNYIINFMVDVHCHLNFKAFVNDYKETIKKAHEDGVKIIINAGTSLESSRRAVELAEEFPNLYAIVGIHPHHADKVNPGWDKRIEKIASSSKKVVAIGEIGLDYYSYASNGIVKPQLQKEVFIKQIKLANKLKLPLQIHNRQAGSDILKILNNHKSLIRLPKTGTGGQVLTQLPGMFHCMSGDVKFLKKVLDLGFYVGFDGNITYEGIAKGEDTPLSELIKNTPIEKIVTETDSPYLTPEPYRHSRNIPSYVIIVAETIAKIKEISSTQVKVVTTQNAKILFNI